MVNFADGNSVDLNAGDCLVYKGYEIEHWRGRFKVRYVFKYSIIIVDMKIVRI